MPKSVDIRQQTVRYVNLILFPDLSELLAKLELSRSIPNTATSPRVLRFEVSGLDSDALNDIRVFVANATLASNVSAPPKALRTRHVALCDARLRQ